MARPGFVFRNWIAAAFAFLVSVVGTTPVAAQTFTTLHDFCAETDCSDGSYPYSGLVQGPDGNYYGTTSFFGAYGGGSVFRITPAGELTTVYSFCAQTNCADGAQPNAALMLASDGKFYGTTVNSGANGYGTIFSLTTDGTLTVLYSFCSQSGCTDGKFSFGALVEGSDGNFYGTTFHGGSGGAGTVFRVTPAGSLTTLYNFCLQTGCPDGAYPYSALVEGSDGAFYGTTSGTESNGTVFRITSAGALTTLHSFCQKGGLCKDGSTPEAGLVLGGDGNFYGTTEFGGTTNCERGLNRRGPGCGTIFTITSTGKLQTLLSFPGPKSGENPAVQLLQATDGYLYGATQYGGTHGAGTLFQTSAAADTLRQIHDFSGYPDDGYIPNQLMQSTDGTFYGTSRFGGTIGSCEFGCGTVFSVSMGLAPFVKTVPAAGVEGRSVILLGNKLQGTNAVSFNGMAAEFTVISDNEIRTSVPRGATTGTIQVKTPAGTLSSKVFVRVKP